MNLLQNIRGLLLAVIFLPTALLSCGRNNVHQNIELLENNTTYTVWETLHTFSDTNESDMLIPNIELVKSLPNSVKAIIAHYSTLIPAHYWDKEALASFVAALGDFSSLKQAQKTLLNQHKLAGLQTAFYKGIPNTLELKQTSNALFVTCTKGWQNSVTDEFRISKNGAITYIENAEPLAPIQYDRKLILDRYYKTHTLKLNGEKIDLRYTYLDYGNIESAGINERDKVIYIEQKDKTPQYFSPSEINISALSFTVKSIDEVTLLIREDGSGSYSVYDNKRTKIEHNAIRMIVNDMISTDGIKYMDIVLLF